MSHNIPKLTYYMSRLGAVYAQFIEARWKVEKEDVLGAAPTGEYWADFCDYEIYTIWGHSTQGLSLTRLLTYVDSFVQLIMQLRSSILSLLDLQASCFWYSPLGEYYCHRHSSDSCRRDFDLVSLICRLWNALSMSGSSVHVYRFSTIFAIDRVWFGCMSMYSSRKRQLLLRESCFAEALEFPLESFLCPDQAVPTLHNPNWREHVSIRRK